VQTPTLIDPTARRHTPQADKHPGLPTAITRTVVARIIGQRLDITWVPFTADDELDTWAVKLQDANDLGDTDNYRLSAAIVTAAVASITQREARKRYSAHHIGLLSDIFLFAGRCSIDELTAVHWNETSRIGNPERIYAQLHAARGTLLTWLDTNRAALRSHLWTTDQLDLHAPDVYLAVESDHVFELGALVINVTAADRHHLILRVPLNVVADLPHRTVRRVVGYGIPADGDSLAVARLAVELFNNHIGDGLDAAFVVARHLAPGDRT
jgi:hypothetical protein